MLQVRKDLCVGCGLCLESCPRGAISLKFGQARIDRVKCNRCGLCLNVCPQGAIVEFAPVSQADLATAVGSLKLKADDLVERIEKLRLLSGKKR